MRNHTEDIKRVKAEWGERLIILGHHYQRANVIQHADVTGDSLELARKAANSPDAERIVFCGVRFMAESADMLAGCNQTVYMPEESAGCPMSNMAQEPDMVAAWEHLNRVGGDWVPIVYVNSSAEIKACCGRFGGSTCTSSNAQKVFRWAFGMRKKILFLPDEHLGFNTAHDIGLDDSEISVYNPARPGGGLNDDDLKNSRVVVWKGFCLVHTAFTIEQVRIVREKMPDARIIVHPESPKEVVRAADAHGSTSQIIKYVESAEDGSTIVIGTENNLVERLADVHRGRVTVKALSPSICANMSMTTEAGLARLLNQWPVRNEVHVDEKTAVDAVKALDVMLSL